MKNQVTLDTHSITDFISHRLYMTHIARDKRNHWCTGHTVSVIHVVSLAWFDEYAMSDHWNYSRKLTDEFNTNWKVILLYLLIFSARGEIVPKMGGSGGENWMI